MIIVKNRELLIPGPERYIGTAYDTESENRQFLLSRFAQNGVDLSALTFRLDLKYANDATDTVVLDKEVTDTNIILTWNIGSSVLQVPGTLFIQLRAVDDEVTVKWSSFHAALYVERHLNTPGTYTGSLTEIEQMEQDHQYMKGVVDELKSHLDYTHEAEAWAIGKKDGEDVPSTDETYHNNSKYYSNLASSSATAAANSATAAAGSATQAAATVADTNTRFNNAMAAVTVNTEVQDARVGADGTTYTVLKNRLDAEHTDVKTALDYTNDALSTGMYRLQNATINSSGVIVAQVSSDPQYQYDLLCYRVTADNPVSFSTLTNGVYAFFTDRPVLSAVSYNASRSNANANSQITKNIPSGCDWIAIRVAHGGDLASISMTPYVISYINKKVYYITPEDFGAVGNGAVNDTNAIQAMFDYIATIANNGVVVCNGKSGARYLVNTINITTDAYNYAHNISINNFQFGLLNNLMFSASSNNHYGFHFNNCIFNAVKSNDPVWANNYVFTYAAFRDCVFNSFKYIIYCDMFEQELTFENCHFISCDTCFYGTAFFTLICKGCVFDHCLHAFEQKMLNGGLATNLRIAQEICFDGCYFDYYQSYVIRLAAYSEVIVEKCYFEHGGLDVDGETHINNRHGILIYDDTQYTRKKSILTVRDNHFQDTADTVYSPRLVDATNSTFDTLIIKGNASYNTRFLSIEGATCTGIIEFFGNVLTSLTASAGNILGDFSSMKLIGYVDGTFYINGSPYGV